uniref:Restriction endonuclease n=1 Tax=Candidatus Kentrum sp. LFY TaxID=2126342 RepID=A0A450UHQ3_9GAMM|nr:MAG: hypothetical protein BECKLFY1418B_GA0070995_10316 [Candidatus Kentron sp. LFY]
MKSSFYYQGHYLNIADKIKEYINSCPDFLSHRTAHSPRAVGDAVESLISEKFDLFLQEWCSEYSKDFARRAMADLAFTDKEGFYSIIDVKTHKEDTKFNMPNLTSVERLARFYESDLNVFSLILIKYSIQGTKLTVSEVTFSPIEFLDWGCLTIGALGWGQIQISDSNNIRLIDGYSRKEWMIELCDTMLSFYPKEILKIKDRIGHFQDIKAHWESREDAWG